jgi:exonuclease III
VDAYLASHGNSLDILCLQEYKLRGEKLKDLGQQLWSDVEFVACEATAAYNHLASKPGARRGGVCFLVAPTLRPLIHSTGAFRHNQAQWLTLRGVPGGDVGVLNVYAPHTAQERIQL